MIRIVTDSTASIPKDLADKHGLEVLSLHINYKDTWHDDANMDVDAFYEDIQEMADDLPTSSQPSTEQMERVFTQIAKDGDELLGIFIGSKMSGTFDAALQVARSVAQQHRGFVFRIVDTTSNSFDEAWAVLEAVRARDEGCTIDECCERAVRSVKSSRFLFVPESLRFLKAGGRIGNAAALLGTLIKLNPVITVADGVSSTFAKVRTQQRALAAMAAEFKAEVQRSGLKNVIVHYIGSSTQARRWAKEVIEPICGFAVDVIPVSPCIGTHVGPAIGLSYECHLPIDGKLSDANSPLVYAS